MKKKLSLPILLLAVVVMLSIFYIKEADKTSDPVAGPSLELHAVRLPTVNASNKEITVNLFII